MSDEDLKSSRIARARDHMANERTFLAWVRTSIGIMAFGFVVEKFALFVKQISILLGTSKSTELSITSHALQGYSSTFGIFLVILGGIICLLAFVKYKKVEKHIEDDTYQPTILLDIMITLSVLLIGIFLVVYLNSSI